MSDAQGPDDPLDDSPGQTPPQYPGWSSQQPQSGPQPRQPEPWQRPGAQQSGWPQQPAVPNGGTGPPPPGGDQGPPSGGWQTPGAWAWRPPDAKPGVIPLRPLGVGEILDGAVTTIRKNLGAMLGLSALVAAVAQLVNLGLTWALLGEFLTTTVNTTSTTTLTPGEAADVLSDAAAVAAISIAVAVLATTFLTGMLTVVVGRAALGEHLTVAQAWRLAKGRLLRLLGLLILYTLIWAGGLVVAAILGLAVGTSNTTAGVGLFVLLALASIPLAIWLYVRFALATPSLMLETTNRGNGGPRPVRIIESLRRSAHLVKHAWWRTFGILLLVIVIVYIVSAVIAVPFALPSAFGNDFDSLSFTDLLLGSLGNIVTMTITTPFAAAAAALVYVDRRIRREGLDLELARAAGVDLPGRSDGGSR